MKNFLWLLILGISTMTGLTSCNTDFDEVENNVEYIQKTGDGDGDGGGGNGGGIPPGGGGG